jgi:hypothetical protein
MFYVIALVVIAYLVYRGKELGYLDKVLGKESDQAAPTATHFFPCVIDGSFTMPEHEARIAARNTSLVNRGHVVTRDDAVDNAVLGGGSPDGGIWLSGRFHFEIDAQGQKTDASWITVFSDEHFPVTGGVTGTGEIRMGSPAGVTITGQIIGTTITGKVSEAGMIAAVGSLAGLDGNLVSRDGNDYLEYVHGVMTGTFTPNDKL